jgi:ABC-type transport system substrate-binding protein
MNRRTIPALRAAAAAVALACLGSAAAPALAQEKVLRVAMTAADIPRTLGQPDQGFEGNRFTGIPMYDALTHWDLSKSDAPSVLIPGLALSWAVDAKDKTKWVFKLRPGVKFHDGSDFNADAVVWNVRKVLDKDAVHFDASQVGVTASRMPTLRTARKIDNLTVELTSSEPDSFLPINLSNLFMASPAHWQKKFDAAPGATPADKAKAAWTAFAADASGSGPFRMARFVPRERLEVVANKAYWDPKRTTASSCCRCPRPTPAPRHCCPDRSTGSRRRRPTPWPPSRAAATRSTSTSSRTSGRGSCPSPKARLGSTSACATPPTSASTAPACSSCWAG